jgi:dihydroneopterin aldolase
MDGRAQDTVFVESLEVKCHIGAGAEERKTPQPIIVDLEMEANVDRAAATDALRDALDYEAVCRDVSRIAYESRFKLVETLASRIADRLLDEYPIRRLSITIRKPNGVAAARYVGVRMFRDAKKKNNA